MLLYHGSNIDIKEIDLAMCRPYKDFGEETSPEWAGFVRNNRSKKFKDYSDPECNLDNKYDSDIYEKLMDAETGLYRESPSYVYGLLQDEINFGHIVQAEV